MKYLILLFFSTVIASQAQITISSPINRAVYQRSLSNTTTLDISGTYNYNIVTSIQARLVNPSTNTAIPGFDWTIIVKNPTKGFFQGKLQNTPAGWYKLEVRALKSGTVLDTQTLERVGVGDVFMIAGQSNAQGSHDWVHPTYDGVGKGSIDERVVTHENEMYCRDTPIPFPTFTQILDQTKIGTAGQAAWLWGNLGERIVDSTKFPVSFFNSGAAGSSSLNWIESAQGLPTIHPMTDSLFCGHEEENRNLPYDTVGMPYSNFKRGLNLYNSMFGARAVLWHQGESDKLILSSKEQYFDNLNYVVNKSREDYNTNLSWMISRASFINGSGSPQVLFAQDSLVNYGTNTFAGPITDDINNNTVADSRDWINLHFSKTIGFPLINNKWINKILYTNFLSASKPIQANTQPIITASVNASNQVVLSVPTDYAAYKWIESSSSSNYEGTLSEGTSNNITKTTGTYRCWVIQSNGNLQVSTPVNVNAVLALTQNGTICSADAMVSNLKYSSASNGIGPVEIDKTNGLESDGDGSSIMLKGISHEKGIGVAGNSEIEYVLPNNAYYKFRAQVGVTDDVSPYCSGVGVVFKIIADGVTIYTSPTVFRSSPVENIDINIYGKKKLILKTEASSGSSCTRGVWASPTLKCNLGDMIDPTAPTNLAISDTLTKCLNFTWAAATDNIAVTGYEVFKNGVLITTLPASTLSYRLSGLSANETVTFGVRAKDAADNKSAIVSLTFTTPTLNLAYMGPAAFCVAQTYLPSVAFPKGGTFNLVSGSAATVNSTTGAFYSNIVALDFVVGYTIGGSIPGCEDNTSISVGTTIPPATPVVTASNTVINEGNSVTLSSSACGSGAILAWNFTASTSNPIIFSPITTQNYWAECKKSYCYVKSNEINVKVIPNCFSTLNLTKPNDNLLGNAALVKFNTSGALQANNVISPTNKIEYNSATSITLNPGFTVEPGVVFKAQINNCP